MCITHYHSSSSIILHHHSSLTISHPQEFILNHQSSLWTIIHQPSVITMSPCIIIRHQSSLQSSLPPIATDHQPHEAEFMISTEMENSRSTQVNGHYRKQVVSLNKIKGIEWYETITTHCKYHYRILYLLPLVTFTRPVTRAARWIGGHHQIRRNDMQMFQQLITAWNGMGIPRFSFFGEFTNYIVLQVKRNIFTVY